jgi:hypothetical protein
MSDKQKPGETLTHVPQMTLWDWYRGQALCGLCSSIKYRPSSKPEEIAEAADKLADLMIRGRK